MAREPLDRIIGGFVRQMFEHFEDRSAEFGRGDSRRRAMPDDDPALVAMRQMEAFYGALAGRRPAPAEWNDASKAEGKARRRAETIVARVHDAFAGFSEIVESRPNGAVDRAHAALEETLSTIARECANRFFAVRAGANGDPMSEALALLSSRLATAAEGSHRELERSIAKQRRAIASRLGEFDMLVEEAETELAMLNRSLEPPVEIDHGRVAAFRAFFADDAGRRLDADLARARNRFDYRLRQFDGEVRAALEALARDPAPVRRASAMDGVAGMPARDVALDRPIPFDTFLADYAEDALALFRAADGACVRSRLGGLPNLPAAMEWPCDAAGPLHFVAQIDLAEMAWRPPTMDGSGTLLFFARLDEEMLANGEGWAVLYDPASTDRTAAAPDGLVRVSGVEFRKEAAERWTDQRLLSGYPLATAAIRSIPDPLAFGDNVHGDARYASYCAAFPEFRTGQFRAATGGLPVSDHLYHHQMFGYVSSAQTPLRANSKTLTLLQIVSDERFGIVIGDMGSLDFCISAEALAHGEWSKVTVEHSGH